jgi:hypothetical protein
LACLDLKLAYARFLAGDVKDAPGEFPGDQTTCLHVHEEDRFPSQAKLATSRGVLQVVRSSPQNTEDTEGEAEEEVGIYDPAPLLSSLW